MGRLLALAAALLVALLVAWSGEKTPRALPLDAPAGAFSATRAMADVRAIGAVPHPMGSAANLAVRDHLLARMTALWLRPEVHRGAAFESGVLNGAPNIYGGPVENLVGVLPGRDRAAPALALMAHYDSASGSPGAADDAAGVASALEIVRAIATHGPPQRDIMVVITDGEESGLLGARAFFARDPAARRIGFVINMETRGAGGRVQMFQTGRDGGGAADLLRRTALDAHASSLSGYVYQRMPNDTDFTVSRDAGIDGLNFAFIGRQFDYHSPTATPANLDTGSLQDMGQQALAAASAVARAKTLPARTPDQVYSQVPGGVMVSYPVIWGWVILAVSGALFALGIVRARRIEPLALGDVARGAGAALFAVIGGMAVLHFARLATGAGFGFIEQRFLLAQAGRWEWAVMLLGAGFVILAAAELARGRRAVALIPLLAGVGSCWLAGFDKLGLGLGLGAALLALAAYGRPVSRPAACAGVLVLGFAVAVAAQIAAPVAAYIFAWPLAAACLAAAATSLSARRNLLALGVMALIAGLGLAWVGGIAHVAFLSLDVMELLGLALLLWALLVWPLAQPDEGAPPARLVGPALLAAGLVLLVRVHNAQPYDARHPQVSDVEYLVDQDAGRAWRITSPEHPPWADLVLKSQGASVGPLTHWAPRRPQVAAAAPFVTQPAPDITFTRQPDGRLVLHAAPPPGARLLSLILIPDRAMSVEAVAGLPARIALKPAAQNQVAWEAAPQGLDLVLRPAGPGALTVRYRAVQEAWPAGAPPLPARPADVMPFGFSDSTVAVGTRRFAW